MAERLEIYRGTQLIRTVPLGEQSLSIGRKTSNEIVLDDLSISKLHAEIYRNVDSWYIRDLDSTNGVVVSGVKIKSAPLTKGKEFVLGAFTLKLASADELAASASGAPKGVPAEPYQDLVALFRLNSRFASVMNTEELLNTMMDRLIEIFRADRGLILLGIDPEEGLQTQVRRGIETSGADAATSRTFIRKALQTKKPVLANDQEAMPVTVEKCIRSILCAPLIEDEQPFGVVYLDSRLTTRIFTPQDMDLLQTFCSNVSDAFKAAREREKLQRAVNARTALARQEALREHDFRDIIGNSPAIRDVLDQVEAVAVQDVTVLLHGESGTGKELFAKAIHYRSPRRDGPFVAINCMALSAEIIESELFGHEKGAFSGAVAQRIGKLEMADGGTVFLDEIGELSNDVQVKLLRVLQEHEIQRVGGNRTIPLDVRLITATNVNLKEAVKAGRFREDLYYRLNVFALYLPPLRDRKEDIPALAEFFIDLMNEKMRRSVEGVSPEALTALQAYDWPGNVRELRNVLERAMVLTRGDRIELPALPFDLRDARRSAPAAMAMSPVAAGPGGAQPGPLPAPSQSLSISQSGVQSRAQLVDDLSQSNADMKGARKALEKKMILDSLRASSGNVSAAARELGLQRKTLHRKIEAFGIDMREFGKGRETLEREQVIHALEKTSGSISAAARELGVPRTTLYRTLDLFGIDAGEIRAAAGLSPDGSEA